MLTPHNYIFYKTIVGISQGHFSSGPIPWANPKNSIKTIEEVSTKDLVEKFN